MKRVFTITVEVQDTDQVPEDDLVGEMAYWTQQVDAALRTIRHTYDRNVEVAKGRVDYQAIDFTNVSTSSTRDWEV